MCLYFKDENQRWWCYLCNRWALTNKKIKPRRKCQNHVLVPWTLSKGNCQLVLMDSFCTCFSDDFLSGTERATLRLTYFFTLKWRMASTNWPNWTPKFRKQVNHPTLWMMSCWWQEYHQPSWKIVMCRWIFGLDILNDENHYVYFRLKGNVSGWHWLKNYNASMAMEWWWTPHQCRIPAPCLVEWLHAIWLLRIAMRSSSNLPFDKRAKTKVAAFPFCAPGTQLLAPG